MKKILRIIYIAALILLAPLIAMQFTDEVNWTAFDFLVAGALLIAAGLIYEFVINRITNQKIRVRAGLILAAALMATWVHLAVGIF